MTVKTVTKAEVKRRKETAANPEGKATVSSFQVPRDELHEFDEYVASLNRGLRGRELSRVDAIRGLMQFAVEKKPDWLRRA